MRVLFLPLCLDPKTLHEYMKKNHQIEEKKRLTMSSAFDENDIPLQGSIMDPPMFHVDSPYKLIHYNKEDMYFSFGNGVSSYGSKKYTIIVLPDGYSVTQSQLDTIAAYAVSLPAPVL